MAEKRETIEDMGTAEAKYEEQLRQSRALHVANSGKVAEEVPKRFFELAGMVREAVRRFNTATDPGRRLTWRESPALAARDEKLSGDFNCEFGRDGFSISVALNAMSRSGKPDVFIVEGSGQLNQERFLLRVEGFVDKTGKIAYRTTVDFQRIDVTFEELAERLVKALVRLDRGILLRGV
jgi:hypothetical protein